MRHRSVRFRSQRRPKPPCGQMRRLPLWSRSEYRGAELTALGRRPYEKAFTLVVVDPRAMLVTGECTFLPAVKETVPVVACHCGELTLESRRTASLFPARRRRTGCQRLWPPSWAAANRCGEHACRSNRRASFWHTARRPRPPGDVREGFERHEEPAGPPASVQGSGSVI